MNWYSCLWAQSFPATVSYPTLRAVCEWRAEPPSLLVPSAPLWQSLLEYHFSEQPCQSFHSYFQGLHENSQRSPGQSARKTNTALAGDPGCPGSPLGCPPGLTSPALKPQGETGRKRLPGARPSISPGVAALSPPCGVTEGSGI